MSSMGDFARDLRVVINEPRHAAVKWHLNEEGVSFVTVAPNIADLLPFSVAWSEHETVIGLDDDARVELGPSNEDAGLAIDIVGAILAGQVTERHEKRRRLFVIDLDDGRQWIEYEPIGRSPRAGNHTEERRFLPYR